MKIRQYNKSTISSIPTSITGAKIGLETINPTDSPMFSVEFNNDDTRDFVIGETNILEFDELDATVTITVSNSQTIWNDYTYLTIAYED